MLVRSLASDAVVDVPDDTVDNLVAKGWVVVGGSPKKVDPAAEVADESPKKRAPRKAVHKD